MKIDPSVSHLVIFLASLISLTLLITTGHDSSPLLHQLVGGLFGGLLGTSGAGAVPAITKFLSGPGNPPTAAAVNTERGRIWPQFSFLVGIFSTLLILTLTACAQFQQAIKQDPVSLTCASSAAALKTLTVARQAGALSPTDIATVNGAVAVVSPVCDAPVKPDSTSAAFTAATAAVAQLQALAAKYPGK